LKILKFLSEEISESIGFDLIWSEIKPISPLGKTEKRNSTPFLNKDRDKLKKELNNLEFIIEKKKNNTDNFAKIKNILTELKDLRGTINRSRVKKTILDDIELFEIKENIIKIQVLKEEIEKIRLNKLFEEDFKDVKELLEILSIGQGESESFYLADEYDAELLKIRKKRKELENKLITYKKKLSQEVEEICRRPLSIEDEISISKNETDIIEKLKKSKFVSLIRENFAALTFKLIENEKIIDLKAAINKSKNKEEIRGNLVRKEITTKIKEFSLDLLSNLKNVAYLDFLMAKAEFSLKINGSKANIIDEEIIKIKNGRHLFVERELAKKGMQFQKIDLQVKKGSTLITGPNMGGKTVALKMVALLVAMAQHALYVPAAEMKFNLRNYIYFTLSSDNLKTGLSSFGTEIIALKEVIDSADNNALILIDEIAHGTNPQEGYAIAYSIIKKLDNKNSISIITTHFERLAFKLDISHLQVKGLDKKLLAKYKNSIQKNGIDVLNKCMDYSLEKRNYGSEVPHDAIKIARVLGFNEDILEFAEKVIKEDSDFRRE
jgi:DNA mismatch repair ATPase MutS